MKVLIIIIIGDNSQISDDKDWPFAVKSFRELSKTTV